MILSRLARCTTSLLLTVGCCTVLADEKAQEDDSLTHQIKVADQQFAVFFQDSTLTGTEKTAIVGDYQHLLEELAGHERRTFSNPKSIGTGNTAVRVIGAFSYSERYVKRPDEVEHEIGLIGQFNDDQECLVIRTKLSDGYRAAMALIKAHEEARRALPQFVALLNNIDETNVPAVKDLFYLPGPDKRHSKELASASKQKIVEEYRPFRYTWTSILELRKFEDRLATIVYAKNKNDGHLYERPLVYDDGHWKIVVVVPGT